METKNPSYAIKRQVHFSREEAIEKITENLKAEGFGILTEIDVKATMKKKLDRDMTQYVILGACNPDLAFKALGREIDIGLLLPCNIVVYEHPENHKTIVAAIDPEAMFQIVDRQDMREFAVEVKKRLANAVNAL